MEQFARRSFVTAASTTFAAAGVAKVLGSASPATADVAPTGSVSYPIAALKIAPTKITWTIDPARSALLVHDMQHYFLKVYKTNAEPHQSLLRNTVNLIAAARKAGVPIFYSAQPGGMTVAQRGLLADFSGAGMPDSDTERAIPAEIAPMPGDTKLTKWKYSEFFHSELLSLLQQKKRDQLILCGIYAFTGVTLTAADAFQNNIAPFLVADSVADLTLARHQGAIEWQAGRTSKVVTTATALKALLP